MKKQFFEFFQIGFGVSLASIGPKVFLLPNEFLDGGITGIAILMSELYGLNISILLISVSFPFLIVSWFYPFKENNHKIHFGYYNLGHNGAF